MNNVNRQLHKYTVLVEQILKTPRNIFVMATNDLDASNQAVSLCKQEKQNNMKYKVVGVLRED